MPNSTADRPDARPEDRKGATDRRRARELGIPFDDFPVERLPELLGG
jgi:hypothetical protein